MGIPLFPIENQRSQGDAKRTLKKVVSCQNYIAAKNADIFAWLKLLLIQIHFSYRHVREEKY